MARVVSEVVLTRRRRVLPWAALALLLAQGCRSLRQSLLQPAPSWPHRPHLMVTKLLLLVAFHAIGCAIDCYSHLAILRWRDFCTCLLQASVYVAPVHECMHTYLMCDRPPTACLPEPLTQVYPLLAIGSSTLLMILEALANKLQVGPQPPPSKRPKR